MKRWIVLGMALLIAAQALAWGQKGHDVVARIAENHLSRRAAREVARVLDGQSMVYWANWMDSASHTPQYAHTKTWHYANVDKLYTYDTMPQDPAGDIVRAIEQLTTDLKEGQLSPVEEADALKMLIHLVGDLHCPMHAGHRSDRGGNNWPVTFFGQPTNLHSLWDEALPEAAHRWSHTEWAEQLDRMDKRQIAAFQQDTPLDWFQETYAVCFGIYGSTPEDSELSYDYVAKFTPIVEKQLRRGGYRLAALLNEIYQ